MKRGTRKALVSELMRRVGVCSDGGLHELHTDREFLHPLQGRYQCVHCDGAFTLPHGPIVRAGVGAGIIKL